MSSAIVLRARRFRQEQRALRYDFVSWMGRPRVFWAVLGLSVVVSLALDTLPVWVSALVVMALFVGLWRAGKSALERRSPDSQRV